MAAEQKGGQVEVNISLAFLHWVGIVLHPWPFVSDIAIFVLKGDVKLQLTNCKFDKDCSSHFLKYCGNKICLDEHRNVANGQPENIMPSLTLSWLRHKNL